ncbi:MAG: hypothetical protein M1819_005857 [Sarea resinae]|nr:MAG: hypothetical protein M1819_005857 [Sarea resinae]
MPTRVEPPANKTAWQASSSFAPDSADEQQLELDEMPENTVRYSDEGELRPIEPAEAHDDGDETEPFPSMRQDGEAVEPSDIAEAEAGLLRPRWLEDLDSRFTWIPWSVRHWGKIIKTWVKGPQPPRIQRIEPWFPRIQTAPLKLLDIYFPKRTQRIWLLIAYYIVWAITFVSVLHRSASSTYIPGYGQPAQVDCTTSYWTKNNGCGLNGNNCRPFDNSTFTFRCPASCSRTLVLNPHTVGDQEANYRPLVIGGPAEGAPSKAEHPIYRGDSYLCASAIHAGMISDKSGGCGVVSLIGEQSDYPSTKRHGIKSLGFDSSFPRSFTFLPSTASQCRDLRWSLLAVSVIFTTGLSLFTTSPAVFFTSLFVGIYAHVGLASDPPSMPNYYAIFSVIIGEFLPAAFVAFVLYRYAIRRTLTDLDAQIEKTVLWLGGCWVGALNNYTFDHIPLQRLTPQDLQQPGAKTALIIIVLSLFTIALGQVWFLRIEGRLPRYLALYSLFVASLLICVIIPGLNLRIHHYILALLLLPGTSMQTRPSLLYQGILMGLFINGIARWGFDPVLQTPLDLRGDGPVNSLLPNITAPIAIALTNITFSWSLPLPRPYDGISVLVNDVERVRAYAGYDDSEFTWTRLRDGEKEYFRFGYMEGSVAMDYTKAGVWQGQSWTEPKS